MPGAGSGALAAEAPLKGWSSVSLKGRKFLFATGRSRIERWPEAEDEPEELVRMVSSASALGASIARHRVLSVSKLDGRGTERWLAWTEGKKAKLAERRADSELLVTTLLPGGGTAGAPPEGWTRSKEQVVTLGSVLHPGPVMDTATRLAHLDELVVRRRGVFPLLTRQGVTSLAFRTVETRRLRRRLRDRDSGHRDWITLEVAVIELAPSAAGGGTLLGMEGPTELWIDVDSGALVRISGKRKGGGGRLSLEIFAFSRKPGPRPEAP